MGRRVSRLSLVVVMGSLLLLLLCATAGMAAAAPGYFGVDFVSATTGWVVGSDSTIMATVDGGKTWKTQYSQAGAPSLLDVCMSPDGKTGWAVGAAGTVLRTTDGRAWTKVLARSLDAKLDYTSVKFVDARTGWIAGGVAAGPLQGLPRGGLWRSADGGLTWSGPIGVAPGWCPVSLDAVGAGTAAAAGVLRVAAGSYNAPALQQSLDGAVWGAPKLLRPGVAQSAQIGDLAFAPGSANLLITGDYSELLPATPFVFSGPAGATYSRPPSAAPSLLRGLSMVSATTGFAVGVGAPAVLKTTTAGATWTVVPAAAARNLYAVDFVSATTGYAVGRTAAATAPLVIKTTDGAVSWIAVR